MINTPKLKETVLRNKLLKFYLATLIVRFFYDYKTQHKFSFSLFFSITLFIEKMFLV